MGLGRGPVSLHFEQMSHGLQTQGVSGPCFENHCLSTSSQNPQREVLALQCHPSGSPAPCSPGNVLSLDPPTSTTKGVANRGVCVLGEGVLSWAPTPQGPESQD